MAKIKANAGKKPRVRHTVLDSYAVTPSRSIFCRAEDLTNEASVETFFIARLLKDIGYDDSQIRTKESIVALTVAQGHKRKKYKPDYMLLVQDVSDGRAVVQFAGERPARPVLVDAGH